MAAPFGNHNSLGHRCSDEAKNKMRISKLGRILSKETRDKMKQSHQLNIKLGLEVHASRRHTKEEIEKIRISSIGRVKTQESKDKISKSKSGNNHPLYGKHLPIEWSSKISKSLKGKHKSEKAKNSQRIRWQNIEHKNNMLIAIMKGNHAKPTKPEICINDILSVDYPKQYKYVGDGNTIIGGHCPDFININGKKQVILVHGVYWHLWKRQIDNHNLTKEEVEIKDSYHYKQYGFDTLIIWEDELKDIESVKSRIKIFNESKH